MSEFHKPNQEMELVTSTLMTMDRSPMFRLYLSARETGKWGLTVWSRRGSMVWLTVHQSLPYYYLSSKSPHWSALYPFPLTHFSSKVTLTNWQSWPIIEDLKYNNIIIMYCMLSQHYNTCIVIFPLTIISCKWTHILPIVNSLLIILPF